MFGVKCNFWIGNNDGKLKSLGKFNQFLILKETLCTMYLCFVKITIYPFLQVTEHLIHRNLPSILDRRRILTTGLFAGCRS